VFQASPSVSVPESPLIRCRRADFALMGDLMRGRLRRPPSSPDAPVACPLSMADTLPPNQSLWAREALARGAENADGRP
jgi:hypothetical protein